MVKFFGYIILYGIIGITLLFLWFVIFNPLESESSLEVAMFMISVFLMPFFAVGVAHQVILDEEKSKFFQNIEINSKSEAIVQNDLKIEKKSDEEESDKDKIISSLQLLINLYERMNPSLIKYRTESTIIDPASNYVSDDEYAQYPQQEWLQLALDRYWKQQFTSSELGAQYERYVGAQYERTGWSVEYNGINNGFADEGVDLICKQNNEVHLVQCKNWRKDWMVREKKVFQLFGKVSSYEKSNPDKKVRGIVYTTTKLSPVAIQEAEKLGIGVIQKDDFFLNRGVNSIKCISNEFGGKVYYLPFDQDYDDISLDLSTGDKYCSTIKEAENSGYTRPYL